VSAFENIELYQLVTERDCKPVDSDPHNQLKLF